MPTRINDEGAPVVTFEPLLEISPFSLFKRLHKGHPPRLVDVRESPQRITLAGAVAEPAPAWQPSDRQQDVVLFDEDGSLALERAILLQEAGYERVKALFGGLELYEFALDPQVVGEETFLVDLGDPSSGNS